MIYKILSLFLNTLTVNDKHYLLNRDNLKQTIQIELSQKQNNFFQFFHAFLESILNFKHLPKKDDPHSLCFSVNTGKCCQCKDPYTGNTENGSKHCSNLNDSTFKIFINYCEGSCI